MVPSAGAQERRSHSWQDGVVPPPPDPRGKGGRWLPVLLMTIHQGTHTKHKSPQICGDKQASTRRRLGKNNQNIYTFRRLFSYSIYPITKTRQKHRQMFCYTHTYTHSYVKKHMPYSYKNQPAKKKKKKPTCLRIWKIEFLKLIWLFTILISKKLCHLSISRNGLTQCRLYF